MHKAERKTFGNPDEVREFPKGRMELVQISGMTVGRVVFEPGWRWSTSLQPTVKTESCQAAHLQYHLSGVLGVRMDDGTELEYRAGDVSLIPAGHEGWVIGDEPVVVIEMQGIADHVRQAK